MTGQRSNRQGRSLPSRLRTAVRVSSCLTWKRAMSSTQYEMEGASPDAGRRWNACLDRRGTRAGVE